MYEHLTRDVEFDVAEVLQYDYTYQYIPTGRPDTTVNNLFAVKVRSCSRLFNDEVLIVRPAEMYSKRIPLVGEFVLIYRTLNQESSATGKRRYQWYYISTVDLHSSINENRLPGISSDDATQTQIDAESPGYTFKSKTVSPLQPYEGDYILEGRWGNSIRFGSTVTYEEGLYSKIANWRGDTAGDPIIILSNRKPESNKLYKEFITEDLETDAASIYLTSTQRINNLILNNDPLKIKPSEYNKSQLIGSSDRIVLTTKSDSVVIDSRKDIQLLASNKIFIGNGKLGYEGVVQGTKLVSVLNYIISALNTGMQTSDGTPVTLINELPELDLTDLTSQEVFISKWRNVGV